LEILVHLLGKIIAMGGEPGRWPLYVSEGRRRHKVVGRLGGEAYNKKELNDLQDVGWQRGKYCNNLVSSPLVLELGNISICFV
jgi:hypothetical protein